MISTEDKKEEIRPEQKDNVDFKRVKTLEERIEKSMEEIKQRMTINDKEESKIGLLMDKFLDKHKAQLDNEPELILLKSAIQSHFKDLKAYFSTDLS